MQGFESRAAVSGSKYANHCARMRPSQMCYFHSLKQSKSYLQTKSNQKTKNAADQKPQTLQFFQKSTFRVFSREKNPAAKFRNRNFSDHLKCNQM